MHDYSIDKHPKQKILYVLAFTAITIAPWATRAIDTGLRSTGAYFGIAAPVVNAIPVATVFAVIFWCFDKYLWRWRAFRRLFLIPDLNGTWSVMGASLWRDGETVSEAWSGKIVIVQSWSKISIRLSTANSASQSVAASLSHEPGAGYRLLYQFKNDPGASHAELRPHAGTTDLLFVETCVSAKGHYFTDQNRRTVGEVQLERSSK
jgi:hypothetical protein